MSLEKVKEYLKNFGLEKRIIEFPTSIATVKEASLAIGVEEEKIAKSLSFFVNDKPIIVVCAGNVKVNGTKFKKEFLVKSKMIDFDRVEEVIGHRVGGVCPFAINDNVKVFFDKSLKLYDKIYLACGNSSSTIELTIDELEKCAKNFQGYVDICK